MDQERARNWVQAERGRAALRALAADLAPAGVELLVFKGIHVGFAVADAPDFRPTQDVDALVVKGTLSAASGRIRARPRWELDDRNVSAHFVRDTVTGAYVDLHGRPLPPRFGRFDVAAALARARHEEALFGSHVWVPDALDAAVLAVANYAKDCFGALGSGHVEVDLRALVERGAVTPAAMAQRLTAHGLRRVGVFSFAHLATRDDKWRPFLEACAPGPAERWISQHGAAWLKRAAPTHPRAAFLGVRTLADRPTDGAVSAALAVLRFARDLARM